MNPDFEAQVIKRTHAGPKKKKKEMRRQLEFNVMYKIGQCKPEEEGESFGRREKQWESFWRLK